MNTIGLHEFRPPVVAAHPPVGRRVDGVPLPHAHHGGSSVRAALAGAAAAAVVLALATTVPLPLALGLHAWVLLLAPVVYLAWGAARGELRRGGPLAGHVAAVLLFGAAGLAAVLSEPRVGLCVLAAGWLAHACIDAAHHRSGRVVPRWYAAACLGADLVAAGTFLVVAVLP